ncbi:MAG: sodium/solute symporter [Bacteroidia bacterium]|nr:sodium/solute symporter [Bacteroidia bacterium]
MSIDLAIVIAYFVLLLILALSGKKPDQDNSESYFLSSRNLRWHSIAISTIATNIQGYQFLGMMGSAYLFGLAQANLEINAITGLWMAAFIFVPLYLKNKVVTITQFIQKKLNKTVATAYSVANILLFSTIGLGAALFWGAYAADLVFAEYLTFISEERIIRITVLIVVLGMISAFYTYYGGLSAVVRTDILQFAILVIGGAVVLFIAINKLGGWEQLYVKKAELMHMHLPSDHPQLPWTLVFGLFLLNINYWAANQTVIQRSLAARSLKDAQIGLMAGGILKYFMAVIIIIPGIALAGILEDNPLNEPDQAFPYMVTNFLPVGVRGLILCALFASLMSTIDSIFNSLSTLFSIDIYKEYINKSATDRQLIAVGRKTIIVTLITGILMGYMLLYVKFENPEQAFTHTLNELRYYINCGIVVLICTVVFMVRPSWKLALLAFVSTIPLQIIFKHFFPEMNYFVRAGWVICCAYAIIAVPTILKNGIQPSKAYLKFASKELKYFGIVLLMSMFLIHWVFH